MAARLKAFLLRRPEQLEALARPARQEVFDGMQAGGPCTVAELAARMDRKPSSLYYHVHALARAGLLVERGRRKSGARDQVVYGLVADKIQIDHRLQSGAMARTLARSAAAYLRQAEREYRAGLLAPASTATARTRRGLFAARMKARLTPQALEQVTRHVLAIQRVFTEQRPSQQGRLCSFTAVLAPADARRSRPPEKSQRKRRKQP